MYFKQTKGQKIKIRKEIHTLTPLPNLRPHDHRRIGREARDVLVVRVRVVTRRVELFHEGDHRAGLVCRRELRGGGGVGDFVGHFCFVYCVLVFLFLSLVDRSIE